MTVQFKIATIIRKILIFVVSANYTYATKIRNILIFVAYVKFEKTTKSENCMRQKLENF